jgi:hypothetical protein
LRPGTPAAAETAVDDRWKRQKTDNGSHPPTAPWDTPSASRGKNVWRLGYQLNEQIKKNGADNDSHNSADHARRGLNFGALWGLLFHRQGTIVQNLPKKNLSRWPEFGASKFRYNSAAFTIAGSVWHPSQRANRPNYILRSTT